MIELTEAQIQSLAGNGNGPPRVVNPLTKETYVLVPLAEYERLHDDYDDSPWTRDELLSLAWQAGAKQGWDEMDEYDQLPEKP